MNERQLLHDYKVNGNVAALQSLVIMHRPFVKFMANKYKADPNTFEDLVQEGILGLIQAINKYDLTHTTKLITYAVYWIRYYISRYLKSQNKYTAVDFTETWEDDRPSPEDEVVKSRLHERIDEAAYKVLKGANEREREIFEARYREAEEVPFRELGERYKISKQRAKQISVKTLDKIRKEL